MKRAATIFCAALLCAQAAFAASPEEMWQDYQKYPGYTTTQPKKALPKTPAHITVETPQGKATVPTAPEAAQAQADFSEAEQAAPLPQNAAKQVQSKNITAAPKQAAAEQTSAEQPQAQAGALQPSVQTQQKAAPKKLKLLQNPPASRQFMRAPQAGDFTAAKSSAGYSIMLPAAFGTDPLAELPNAQGAMLVRSAGNTLLCAVTVLDAADTASFKNNEPLPAYTGKKIYLEWRQGAAPLWRCLLSRHKDFYGDKLLLEASTEQNAKIYQALYVMPAEKFASYLPQALYSLNSMKIEA